MKNFKPCNTFNYQQQGAGLVELMIAVAIGMFLLVGLGLAFASMNATAIARKSLSDLQEAERTSMLILGNFIQQAGFYLNPQTTSNTAAFPAATVAVNGQSIGFSAGQVVVGTTSGSGTAQQDTINVRYMADPNFPQGTCFNNSSATASAVYIDSFSVINNALTCTEYQSTGGAALVSLGTRTVVNNISQMTITYGIDNGSGNGSVNQYVPTATLLSSYQWSMVKTIVITVVYNYNNPLNGQATTASFSRTIAVMNAII